MQAKARAVPVQTVVTKHAVQVTEVSHDGTLVHYSPPSLQRDQPIETDHGLVFVADTTPGQITLEHSAQIEPGDQLYQSTWVSSRAKVFEAFVALWKPMWTKHSDAPPEYCHH